MKEKIIPQIDHKNPHEMLINKEKVIQIMEILNTNYSHPESLILLYYASGFNYSEIARRLKLQRNRVSEIYYEQESLIRNSLNF